MPTYFALGSEHDVQLQALSKLSSLPTFLGSAPAAAINKVVGAASALVQGILSMPVLRTRLPGGADQLLVVQGAVAARAARGVRSAGRMAMSSPAVMTLATPTVIAEGMRMADFQAAKQYGAEVIEEGLDGKVLLRVDTVDRAFGLVHLLMKREVGSVSPNFIRRVVHTRLSTSQGNWSLHKIDAAAAWAITKGVAEVKVAVLDEGVDTAHPSLRHAVMDERDFIGNKGLSAMPDGDDAHGTACAGIISSNDKTCPGIAPRCGLIAARIAMDDGQGGWVFDDFRTADAIDWCWRSGAAVLSNSWGGGAPSDPISRAFARARTQGRGGLGAVVAIAAGNGQDLVQFPGDLPGYVTVGASNPADERKTKTSSDGETWWGSSFGPSLHLLAPGVFISTTDIAGQAGYETGDFTSTYNGTSSATPAVAAVAALMIAANPALSASSVRTLLGITAKRFKGQKDWTMELGWGRLDAGAAVAAAKAAAAAVPTKAVPAKTVSAKKVLAKKVAAKKVPAKKALKNPGKAAKKRA